MTINGTININGAQYRFETDEVDKAIKAIVLLSGKENGENNNAIEVLRSIADNLNDTESELDEYVEDEDDEEIYDTAYDEAMTQGTVVCIASVTTPMTEVQQPMTVGKSVIVTELMITRGNHH